MTNEELLELAHLGRTAEELLAEPLIARWFEDLDKALIEGLKQGSREEAAHWHDLMECADKLRSVLDAYLRTGQVAAERLRAENEAPAMRLLDGFQRFRARKRA